MATQLPYTPTMNPDTGYASPHANDVLPARTAYSKTGEKYIELRATAKLEVTRAQLAHAKKWNARLFIFALTCLSGALFQVLKASGWSAAWFFVCFTFNFLIFLCAFADITKKIRKI